MVYRPVTVDLGCYHINEFGRMLPLTLARQFAAIL
jgi:hypothetical protein